MIPTEYFDRFATPKYRNKNPVQRQLIRRFARSVHELFLAAQPARTVLEVGVGEGFVSGYLSEKFPHVEFTGVDLNPEDIERVRGRFPRIDARVGSAYDLGGLGEPRDILICCEVLEHLDDPAKGLRELRRMTGKHAILSVPHEPYFMLSNLLRAKNVVRLGNDPEHVNHWGMRSFRKFVEQEFDVLETHGAFPWVLVLARPK